MLIRKCCASGHRVPLEEERGHGATGQITRRQPLSIIDELRTVAHGVIHLTSGAWDVVARWAPSRQHLSGIIHLLVVHALDQSVGKCVPAEMAPEVSATTEYFSIPIDLRIIPQLKANITQIFMAMFLLELVTSDRLLSCLSPNELFVANGRKLAVPIQLGAELHAQLFCHRASGWDFMLIVTEHD